MLLLVLLLIIIVVVVVIVCKKYENNQEGFANPELKKIEEAISDKTLNSYYFPFESDTYFIYQFNYPEGYTEINEYYNRDKIIISPEYPLVADNLQEEPFHNLSINKNALRFQHTSQPLTLRVEEVNPKSQGVAITFFWKFENPTPEDLDILGMGRTMDYLVVLKLRQKQFELEFLYPMITKPIITKRKTLELEDLKGWLMMTVKMDRLTNSVSLYCQTELILEYQMGGQLPIFDTITIRPNVENIRFRKGKQILLGLLDSIIYYNKPLSDQDISNSIHAFLLFRSSSPRMIGFEYPNFKGRYQYYYPEGKMEEIPKNFKPNSLIIPSGMDTKLEYQTQPYRNVLNQADMEEIELVTQAYYLSLELNPSFLIEFQKYQLKDGNQNQNNSLEKSDSRYQITIYGRKLIK